MKLIPPKYLNIFMVFAIVFHFTIPVMIIIPLPFKYLGIIPILIGISLNIWAVKYFTVNNISTSFNNEPTKLLTEGPFRISRNPIYLSGVLITIGIAIILGSMVAFLFPILLLLISDIAYIPTEEKILAKLFGKKYLEYKQKVRRWI